MIGSQSINKLTMTKNFKPNTSDNGLVPKISVKKITQFFSRSKITIAYSPSKFFQK